MNAVPSSHSGLWRKAGLWLIVTLLVLRAAAAVTSPAGLHWDFSNYYHTGCRGYYGEWNNLYRVDSLIRGMRPPLGGDFDFIGFPLIAPAFLPLCVLPLQVAFTGFKLFCLACYVIAFWILYRHFRRLSRGDSRFELNPLLFLGAVLLFEPAWRIFPVGGQTTPLAFLLLVVFLDCYLRQRLWPAAAALCVAFFFKPFLAVMAFVFLAGREFKLLLRLATCLAVAGAVSMAIFGWGLHQEWLSAALQKTAARVLPWWYNVSLGAVLSNFWVYFRPSLDALEFPLYLKVLLVGLRMALTTTMLWLAWRAYHSSWPEAQKQFWYAGCAVALALLFPFIVWAHYLVFLLPLWMYWAMQFRRLDMTARVLLIGWFLSTFRANQIFARELGRRFLTVDTAEKVALVGLYASATLSLTLCLLICFRPRKEAAAASQQALSE